MMLRRLTNKIADSKVGIFWARKFLAGELGISIFFGIAFWVWGKRFHGQLIIDSILQDNRAAIYTAISTISASLFGFVIAAVAIILGFTTNGPAINNQENIGSGNLPNIGISPAERMALLRQSDDYQDLWNIFTSAIRALSFATIAALVGLILDRDTATGRHSGPIPLVFYVVFFTVTLSVYRLYRCVWILEKLIRFITYKS